MVGNSIFPKWWWKTVICCYPWRIKICKKSLPPKKKQKAIQKLETAELTHQLATNMVVILPPIYHSLICRTGRWFFPTGRQPVAKSLRPKRHGRGGTRCTARFRSLKGHHFGKESNFDANLGGGFKDFLFSPLLGEMIQFDSYFFKWVETTN